MRRKKKKRRRRAANEEADKVVERFLYAGPRHRAVRAFSIHGFIYLVRRYLASYVILIILY
jgi:hypothetical protein